MHGRYVRNEILWIQMQNLVQLAGTCTTALAVGVKGKTADHSEFALSTSAIYARFADARINARLTIKIDTGVVADKTA